MPPYPKHLETSAGRTGNDYQKLHDWLDNYSGQQTPACPRRHFA